VSQGFKGKGVPLRGSTASSQNSAGVHPAAEASVRQLIANGKYKTALESAKEIHKRCGSAASESLLLDAYQVRIHSLLQQNLVVEAQALLDLVRERYPSGAARWQEVSIALAARSGSLDELVGPLGDPALAPERRAAIERAIQQQVWDLQALAGFQALPPGDPLRQAAAALDRAFREVTSGPATDDALALPEVSRRSPLAPWKLLVRATGCFYRGEDEACGKFLDAIDPAAVPARLVPAIRAMLDGRLPGALTPAAAALVSQTVANPEALRRALQALDRAFEGDQLGVLLKAIRAALEECRPAAPDLLDRLRQHIYVRCELEGVDRPKTVAALGSLPRRDAYFCRLYARALEEEDDPESLLNACGMWNEFRQSAVREGWFASNGLEAATLYLHMASLLRKVPGAILREVQKTLWKRSQSEECVYLFPEKLYERAAALDPHTETFAAWLDWAKSGPQPQAERVAKAWNRILPADIEPVLYLMRGAESRSAYPTALGYLTEAERIDGVHPAVRRARLRLMAGSIIRHIQQKRPHLAEEKLVRLSALPQAQQGDRAALLAAFRYVLSTMGGRMEEADRHRSELERVLESKIAGSILIASLATACKQHTLARLGPAERLSPAERGELPAAVARAVALAADVGIGMRISKNWLEETARQLPERKRALDPAHLRTLAEAGLCAGISSLAYEASGEGLQRGATEARFLFLRARSVPGDQARRMAACAAAAAEMARRQRDTELIEESVNFLHEVPVYAGASLTFEQAAEVLRREKAARSSNGNPVPEYADLIPDRVCQCPACRRARGEAEDNDDDDDSLDADDFLDDIPPDMPKEIARMLFEEVQRAVERGESMDEFLDRVAGGRGHGPRRKGRRR